MRKPVVWEGKLERRMCVEEGLIVALNSELARVGDIDYRNFVCTFYWHQLRTSNNICLCLLPNHSATLSSTPIPERLYKVFDDEGRKMPSYHPDTKWCTSCQWNADKISSSKDEYQKLNNRKRVGRQFGYFTLQHLCRLFAVLQEMLQQKILLILSVSNIYKFNVINIVSKRKRARG